MVSRFLVACMMSGLAACAAPPATAPPGAPAPSLGPGVRYEVVASDIAIEVFRDGPLAELGHNHVIGSTALTGRIAVQEPATGSSFEFELPVAAFIVDEPERLAAAGPEFPDRLSAQEKQATLRNMLSESLLDAGRFPVVRLESGGIGGEAGALVARTRVTIAGRPSEVLVPVTLVVEGETLRASGQLTLTHSQLGLTPFSTAMGALRVADELRVSWRVQARREAGDVG